jgi:2-polyprenyl-3-methyl-5-hydroxy-6-metoxy-1,4-benzoquinol methylase
MRSSDRRISWDDDWGDWQGLGSADQVLRYVTIPQTVARLRPQGSVLDVGCGEGLLRRYLSDAYKYTGIEPSSRAVLSTQNMVDSIVHARCEDVVVPKGSWDFIVFNEVLYYLADPIGVLAKYASAAASGGYVVISIFQKPHKASLKQRLRHLSDRRRPMSNAHCTEMVVTYLQRCEWPIDQDVMIVGANACTWRLIVARVPCRPGDS